MRCRLGWQLAAAGAVAVCVLAAAVLLGEPWQRDAHERPSEPARGAAEAFVFADQAPNITSYWLADAQNPSVRKLLATVRHPPGRSGEASVSPDGRWLAYTVLPPAAADPDHQAELWLLRLAGGAERAAAGVDLLSFLVWSPDSASVTFERVADQGIELWRQTLGADRAHLLQAAAPSEVLIPAGYDREGARLIAARLGPAGTDIVRIAPTGLSVVSHAGSRSGRDFVLSPDRTQLAFLSAAGVVKQPEYQAQEVDLSTGSTRQVGQQGTQAIGLAWRPDGVLTIGGAGATSGLRTASGSPIFPSTTPGFEQPLAWSSSGTRLAVRRFSGESVADPGSAQDLLIEPNGARRAITSVDPVQFVGWIAQ